MEEQLVTSVVGVLVFTCHLPIILLITTSPQLRAKKSNHLLLNLSIGHILTGISNAIGPWTHLPWGTLAFGGYCYANISQLMLTIDRCLFIRFPFRYQFISFGTHVLFLMASPVTYISIIVYRLTRPTLVAVDVDRAAMLSFIICVSGFMVLFMVPNLVIFAVVRRQKRAIKATSTTSRHPTALRNKWTSRRKEISAFYICFGCVLTYTGFWLPSLIIKLEEFVSGHPRQRLYFNITIAIANLNPLVDAIILVFYKKELRNRTKTLVKKGRMSQRSVRIWFTTNKDKCSTHIV
jgi:Serpentine type 7TM GPCR chemoreceptor Srsx.